MASQCWQDSRLALPQVAQSYAQPTAMARQMHLRWSFGKAVAKKQTVLKISFAYARDFPMIVPTCTCEVKKYKKLVDEVGLQESDSEK